MAATDSKDNTTARASREVRVSVVSDWRIASQGWQGECGDFGLHNRTGCF